ncbi:MAG: 3-phosphoglycerate dehydrogenase [Oscillospiraceae bacterium]|jgi:D-3-phosphoglycerate dehydrogenase|nr:3-phosphoglycerate dehydrogenase [Oscillospiraceae bacterium]
MYKIKTLNSISRVGLDILDPERYEVGEFDAPDAILVRSAKMHDAVFNPELLCIARAGAGTNNIPTERCAESGVVVFNTPGANSEAVKELVLGAMLLSSRDLIGGIKWVQTIADKGDEVASLVEAGKNKFVGPELYGKTLGVIGLGAIGAKIANDAIALGMNVYGYDPYLSVDAAWRLSSKVTHAKELGTLLRNSDYITIHVPYMDSTHHYISGDQIAQMRDGARLINLARAELVDDDAVVAALASGKLSRYVTDFPNGKTAGADGVIAIPHLGASTPESEDNCAYMAVAQVIDYIENGNIVNSVNMPTAFLPRTGGDMRVCVYHRNVPDMISKIAGALSARGLNIENMLNAGGKGGNYAYTLIDVRHVPEGVADALAQLKDVIKVRVLA